MRRFRAYDERGNNTEEEAAKGIPVMAARDKLEQFWSGGLEKPIQTLATSLAEKGNGGLALLALICLAGWIATIGFIGGTFWNIPKFKPPYEDGAWITYTYLGFMVVAALLFALISLSITRMVLLSIVGTIRAEAEAKSLTAAFGGRIATADGSIALSRLPEKQALRRIQGVMKALVSRASTTLAANNSEVRSNIFTTRDGLWLSIVKNLHVNMSDKNELGLQILNGFYSTGTTFRYSRPTLSIRHGGKWQYVPDPAALDRAGLDHALMQRAEDEVKRADKRLAWIISMPIPYQVNPFSLTCGVLNLDGFQTTLHRDQLKALLADAATAAALVGVVNRTTDLFRAACSRSDESFLEPENVLQDQFDIPATEFDPAECPEPSQEFTTLLSQLRGLEFFKKLAPSDVALFLREQLRY